MVLLSSFFATSAVLVQIAHADLAIGEPCGDGISDVCENGLICLVNEFDHGFCKVPKVAGDDCSDPDSFCESPLMCDPADDTCRHPLLPGEDCSDTTGTFCEGEHFKCDPFDRTCKEARSEGDVCSDEVFCWPRDTVECIEYTCVVRGGIGSPCHLDGTCDDSKAQCVHKSTYTGIAIPASDGTGSCLEGVDAWSDRPNPACGLSRYCTDPNQFCDTRTAKCQFRGVYGSPCGVNDTCDASSLCIASKLITNPLNMEAYCFEMTDYDERDCKDDVICGYSTRVHYCIPFMVDCIDALDSRMCTQMYEQGAFIDYEMSQGCKWDDYHQRCVEHIMNETDTIGWCEYSRDAPEGASTMRNAGMVALLSGGIATLLL